MRLKDRKSAVADLRTIDAELRQPSPEVGLFKTRASPASSGRPKNLAFRLGAAPTSLQQTEPEPHPLRLSSLHRHTGHDDERGHSPDTVKPSTIASKSRRTRTRQTKRPKTSAKNLRSTMPPPNRRRTIRQMT